MMVILVLGLPGSGKTYFAQRLSEKISAVHFNSDNIRKEIKKWNKYDDVSKMDVYDAMLEKMRHAIQAEKNVVLDATFYKRELRAKFQHVLKQLKQPLILIEVKAMEDTIRRRLSTPRADSQADYEVYRKVSAEYEPVVEDHLVLFSDKEPLEVMLVKTLNHIAENAR